MPDWGSWTPDHEDRAAEDRAAMALLRLALVVSACFIAVPVSLALVAHLLGRLP